MSKRTNLKTKQHKDLIMDYFKPKNDNDIKQIADAFKDNTLKDLYLNALKTVYDYAFTSH